MYIVPDPCKHIMPYSLYGGPHLINCLISIIICHYAIAYCSLLSNPSDQQVVPTIDGDRKSAPLAIHDLPVIDGKVYLGLMENMRSLMKRTRLYLQETGCATDHVVTCIMDVRHIKCISNESQLKQIVSATSISDVFSGLCSRNVITFEHYSAIKRLIITLCSKSEALQMELKVYENEFGRFTQSKLLKSARFCDKQPCGNGDMVELIITIDGSWNECPIFMKVLDLEITVANVFQCETFALHLRSIDHEAKSLRLWFAVSIRTLKSVFPLTTEEWVTITNQGVVELKCLEFHYKVHEKGTTLFLLQLQSGNCLLTL